MGYVDIKRNWTAARMDCVLSERVSSWTARFQVGLVVVLACPLSAAWYYALNADLLGKMVATLSIPTLAVLAFYVLAKMGPVGPPARTGLALSAGWLKLRPLTAVAGAGRDVALQDIESTAALLHPYTHLVISLHSGERIEVSAAAHGPLDLEQLACEINDSIARATSAMSESETVDGKRARTAMNSLLKQVE